MDLLAATESHNTEKIIELAATAMPSELDKAIVAHINRYTAASADADSAALQAKRVSTLSALVGQLCLPADAYLLLAADKGDVHSINVIGRNCIIKNYGVTSGYIIATMYLSVAFFKDKRMDNLLRARTMQYALLVGDDDLFMREFAAGDYSKVLDLFLYAAVEGERTAMISFVLEALQRDERDILRPAVKNALMIAGNREAFTAIPLLVGACAVDAIDVLGYYCHRGQVYAAKALSSALIKMPTAVTQESDVLRIVNIIEGTIAEDKSALYVPLCLLLEARASKKRYGEIIAGLKKIPGVSKKTEQYLDALLDYSGASMLPPPTI